jgi:Domain of unknown function (DUF2017)
MLPRPRIKRSGGGELRLRLPGDERELLHLLCEELRKRVEDEPDHPDLRRLFPSAHAEDADAEAEYQRLVGRQLASGRDSALETVGATIDREALTVEEAEAWLTVLNDLRLVLGTRLDVTEEMDFDLDPYDPGTAELAVYAYLSWLQEQLVEALALGMR